MATASAMAFKVEVDPDVTAVFLPGTGTAASAFGGRARRRGLVAWLYWGFEVGGGKQEGTRGRASAGAKGKSCRASAERRWAGRRCVGEDGRRVRAGLGGVGRDGELAELGARAA